MRFDQRATSSSATRGKAVDLTESAAGRTRHGLLFVALLAFAPSLLLAKVTGNISGTVKDAQGAVMPGVTVTARNIQTGVAQTLLTDDVGFYNFAALPIGTYDVSFQKTGFTPYRETGLVINVDTALRVDAVPQVGAETQTVTVEATAAQVDTQTQPDGRGDWRHRDGKLAAQRGSRGSRKWDWQTGTPKGCARFPCPGSGRSDRPVIRQSICAPAG